MNLSSTEPTALVAGDTIKWSRPDLRSEYPDGTLAYRFVGESAPFTLTCDANFGVTLNSASMGSGTWTWTAAVTVAGERSTVGSGMVQVRPDPFAILAATDTRSHARRVLEAVEAVIEGRATEAHYSTTMDGGRSVTSLTPQQLADFRERYAAKVAAEDHAARMDAGLSPLNVLSVSF